MARVLTGAILLVLLLAPPAAAEPVGPELTFAQEDVRGVAVSLATPERALVLSSLRESYAGRILGRDEDADGAFDPILGAFPAADGGHAVGSAANPDRREHLLAWPQDGELRARRLAALGGPVGPAAIVLAPLPAGAPAGPDGVSVAFSEARKEFLVAWSEPGAGGAAAIRARRVSDAGAPVGAVLTVSDDAARPRNLAPQVAARPDGWHVVWTGIRDDGRSEVLGEPLEADGGQRGSERVLAEGSAPALAADPGGEALVAWVEAGGVLARRLGRATEGVGEPVRLAASASSPAAAWSAAGLRYLVVWRGTSDRIRGRLLDAEGGPVGEAEAEEEISLTEAPTRDPAVAAHARSEGFLVAWGTPARGLARWVAGGASGDVAGEGVADPYAPYPPGDYPYESAYADGPYPSEDPGDELRGGDPEEGSRAGFALVGSPTLRRLAGAGLGARLTCAGSCVASLRLTVSAATARRYRLPSTLASVTRRLRRAGTASATLRPRAAVRRRLRALARVRVTAVLDVTRTDGGHERRRRGVTIAR